MFGLRMSRPYYSMNEGRVCVLEKERGGWWRWVRDRDRNINNANEKEVGVGMGGAGGGSFTFPDSGSNSLLYLESVLANSAVSNCHFEASGEQ